MIVRFLDKLSHLERTRHWPEGPVVAGMVVCLKCMDSGFKTKIGDFRPLRLQKSLVL